MWFPWIYSLIRCAIPGKQTGPKNMEKFPSIENMKVTSWCIVHLDTKKKLALTLIKCKKLGSLFTQSVSRCLLQLEDLWIADCVALEGIIGKDDQGEATSIQSPSSQFKMEENGEMHEEEVMDKIIFPQLKNLLLQNLPCLRSFYSGDAAIECPSLEQVLVQDCPYFGTSTSDFNSNKTIQFNNEQHFLLLQKRYVVYFSKLAFCE